MARAPRVVRAWGEDAGIEFQEDFEGNDNYDWEVVNKEEAFAALLGVIM